MTIGSSAGAEGASGGGGTTSDDPFNYIIICNKSEILIRVYNLNTFFPSWPSLKMFQEKV